MAVLLLGRLEAWRGEQVSGAKAQFVDGLIARAKARAYLRSKSNGKCKRRFPTGMTNKRDSGEKKGGLLWIGMRFI